jgi:hypothetical protein
VMTDTNGAKYAVTSFPPNLLSSLPTRQHHTPHLPPLLPLQDLQAYIRPASLPSQQNQDPPCTQPPTFIEISIH